MNNKNIRLGWLMIVFLWASLTAWPLGAQQEPEAGPETGGAPAAADQNQPGSQPLTGGDTIAATPEAETHSPGFLRSGPANVDADGNRLPQNRPGLKAKKMARRLTSPHCHGNYQDFVYYYPQGFGNTILDAEIERLVTEAFNREAEARRQAGFCDSSICHSASCKHWGVTRTFEVHLPSAGYASILFNDYSETGGAHPNTAYEARTYSLSTGQPMTLDELFPRGQDSVAKYWEMVYHYWCESTGNKFPLHYRLVEPCSQPDNPGNPNTYTWASYLSDLGRLVFTPEGASMIFAPYEAGSYATGTVVMDFSKENMIGIGAAPSIWGQ